MPTLGFEPTKGPFQRSEVGQIDHDANNIWFLGPVERVKTLQ